jgi:hypothetical protein
VAASLWSNLNTCLEIGLEVLRFLEANGKTKGAVGGMETEMITDGVLLISNDKEILLAVKMDVASQALSDAAMARGTKKNGYLCYNGAAAAIPLYELSRTDADIRDYIVNEESLRATLCGNYPEFVRSHNLTAPPDARIEDADAPPLLFLQKQLDIIADETRSEVAAFGHTYLCEAVAESGLDVLELER